MDRGNNRILRRWCLIGIVAVMALAALWHFIYDWLPCGFLSTVSPVNESPWEHAKLFFIPPLIWYVIMYFGVGRRYPNYVFACAVLLLVMPVLMLLIYSACHLLGVDSLPVDIANALVSITLGLWVTYRLTVSVRKLNGPLYSTAAVVILAGLLVVYAVLTYYPPQHPLFWDQQTHQYGIPR
jgi:hypothetical protein